MFIGQFHSMQAYLYQEGTVIQLVSYQSIVAEYDTVKHVLTLFDRWQYSPTTIRQVYKFIYEFAGLPSRYINVEHLRKLAKQGYVEEGNTHTMILNHWTIQFSNKYPRG